MAHPVINRSNEHKRDALVAYALAHLPDDVIDPGAEPPATLATRIRTAEDLYEYLLLDTRISGDVETAPLAEAIGSVQLYIDRCLQQLEPAVDDGEGSPLTEALRPQGFLAEWDTWNKRYATWSGREQALFYPEPYLDPMQRSNSTLLFGKLVQTLDQGRLTLERVEQAYRTYLATYDELTDLDTIAAYQDGTELGNQTRDTYYLVGRSRNTLDQFYWRTLDMRYAHDTPSGGGGDDAASDPARRPLVTAWSQWQKIDAGIGTALGAFVAPFMMGGRLHAAWLTEELQAATESDAPPVTATFVETARLRHDGSWQRTRKFALNMTGQTVSFEQGFSVVVDDRAKWLALFFEGNITPVQISYYETSAAFKPIEHAEYGAWGNVGRPGENRPTLLFRDEDSLDGDVALLGRSLRPLATEVAPSALARSASEAATAGTRADAPLTYCVIEQSSTGWCTVKLTYLLGADCPHFAFSLTAPAPAEPPPNPSAAKVRAALGTARSGCAGLPGRKTGPGAADEVEVLWEVTGEVSSGDTEVEFFFDVIAKGATLMTLTYTGTDTPDGAPLLQATTHFSVSPLNYIGAQLNDNVLRLGPPSDDSVQDGAETQWWNGEPIRLSTHFAATDLRSRLGELAGGNLMYALQTLPVEPAVDHPDTLEAIDFDGAYGIYFWEMFFHAPYLVATRLRQNQRFDDANQWTQHLFNPGGYRRADGTLDLVGNPPVPRYWNVRPLQDDTSWNPDVEALAAPDPYAVALADPMHYKMAVFMHTLDLMIERGDASYRRLDRDSLGEAKMFYVQAGQLLGPRPVPRYGAAWEDPTLGDLTASPQVQDQAGTRMPVRAVASAGAASALRADLREIDGPFLPPYDENLLAYWDKLEVRLYNLRHNLTLDGQPFSLPLYAQPVYVPPGNTSGGSGDGAASGLTAGSAPPSDYRYTALATHADRAVVTLVAFGKTFLHLLEQRDDGDMAVMLLTQEISVRKLVRTIEDDNLAALDASRNGLQRAQARAEERRAHYAQCFDNWISPLEDSAINKRALADANYLMAQPWYVTSAALNVAPNVFGFSMGGSDWGGPAQATALGFDLLGKSFEVAAEEETAQAALERRREEWGVQRDLAQDEAEQLAAQISALDAQIAMAAKQISLADMEAANAQARFELSNAAFTGPALWSWSVGRLSALYYQLYDAVMPLCLCARAAFEAEFGAGSAGPAFSQPAWNDLYQGLLAGEALALDLQRLRNRYLQLDKRALEIEKIISADALISQRDASQSFASLCTAALDKGSAATPDGVLVLTAADGGLNVALDLVKAGSASDYVDVQGTRRIKHLSITLMPTPLGPPGATPSVEALLSLTGNARATNIRAAISRGVDDGGLFNLDFDDRKTLPFEGCDPATGMLTLRFYKTGNTRQPGVQYALLKGLTDVRFHVRYTVL